LVIPLIVLVMVPPVDRLIVKTPVELL